MARSAAVEVEEGEVVEPLGGGELAEDAAGGHRGAELRRQLRLPRPEHLRSRRARGTLAERRMGF